MKSEDRSFAVASVRLLIIRFSSIGDVLLTTPVIRAAKLQMHGGAEIHVLTKASFAKVLSGNPHIDQIITFERSTNEVMPQLRSHAYHYIIDLQGNLRSLRVKRRLKVLSFTVNKLNVRKWLLVNLGINTMPHIHVVDRYLECLKPFGIADDGGGLDFYVPEMERLSSQDLPITHRDGYVGVVIAAAHWRKRLRAPQYVQLLRCLSYPTVLIGGPAEQALGEEIAAACGAEVWNSAGKLSLFGSAELLRMSRLVITPDTGMMHLAAALQKPILSMWMATVPDFGMYPYRNRALELRFAPTHLRRRPCSKLGSKCKYKPCKCVDEFPVKALAEQGKALVSQPGTKI